MSAIFGPAGNAESFPYKSSADAPRWLAELGLDCYEYQCGKGVNVREETARNMGAAAVAAAGVPAAAPVRQSSSWTAAICTTALSILRAA